MNFGEITSKFILDKVVLIEEHLDNHIKNYKVAKDISKLNFKENIVYCHHQVVSKIGANHMAGFLMHIALDLVSRESNKGNLVQTEIFNSFGSSLINKYIFLSYTDCVKDTIKNSGQKLTLSEWKKLKNSKNYCNRTRYYRYNRCRSSNNRNSLVLCFNFRCFIDISININQSI